MTATLFRPNRLILGTISAISLMVIPLNGQAAKERPLNCRGIGFTSTYRPPSKSIPLGVVNLTFRGKKPTPAEANAAVRRCMIVADSEEKPSEIQGFAFWSKTGTDFDDDAQDLGGSISLVRRAGSKQIMLLKDSKK